jgi:hypothetical protein
MKVPADCEFRRLPSDMKRWVVSSIVCHAASFKLIMGFKPPVVRSSGDRERQTSADWRVFSPIVAAEATALPSVSDIGTLFSLHL